MEGGAFDKRAEGAKGCSSFQVTADDRLVICGSSLGTLETLADADAVLVLDETGFLKKGDASCGVAHQYTGSVGKLTNCQIGVFAAYVSRYGHAFIDRALYLPKSWTSDPARRVAAHVPAAIGFATKPQLGGQMIRRAMDAGVPFAWVTGDTVYGVGAVEMATPNIWVVGGGAAVLAGAWAGG